MHISEGYVFQIMEIIDSRNAWIVAGLAFDTITKDDILSLSSPEMGYIDVHVTAITLYGQQVEEVTRGLTAKLVLDSKIDLSISIGYLYKQS